jgi:hypothetical protein
VFVRKPTLSGALRTVRGAHALSRFTASPSKSDEGFLVIYLKSVVSYGIRDGNVLGLPPKNLRTEGVEAINRGNQRQRRIFHDLLPAVLSVPGESQGDSDRVNLQGRRDDVVEFTRAVGDDSSKYHRPHRQADHGLHYGRFQTERFCGSGSRRVLSVQVVPGLTGRCRIYPPASREQW